MRLDFLNFFFNFIRGLGLEKDGVMFRLCIETKLLLGFCATETS